MMTNTDTVVSRAKEAWQRVKEDSKRLWTDWLLIGEAMEIGRDQAMRRAGASRPVGRGYNEAFSRWLADNGFADMDKGERARLFDIMANLSDVDQWRASLENDADRRRFNHPNAVWRQWQAWKRREGHRDAAPAPKQQSQQQANLELQAENDRLHERVEALESEINAGGIGSRETLAEILDYVDKKLDNADLRKFVIGLNRIVKARRDNVVTAAGGEPVDPARLDAVAAAVNAALPASLRATRKSRKGPRREPPAERQWD